MPRERKVASCNGQGNWSFVAAKELGEIVDTRERLPGFDPTPQNPKRKAKKEKTSGRWVFFPKRKANSEENKA